jgi:hypothetical protein
MPTKIRRNATLLQEGLLLFEYKSDYGDDGQVYRPPGWSHAVAEAII